MMKLTTPRTWMSVLALTLASPFSHADVLVHTYPGTECKQLYTTTPSVYYNLSGAYNDSTSAVTFACPMSSARYLNDSGTSTTVTVHRAYWWVAADDRSASGNVSCQVRSCIYDSTSCTSSLSLATSGTGINQLLSTLGSFNFGTYNHALTLICTVPGKAGGNRSGIRNYTLYAFD